MARPPKDPVLMRLQVSGEYERYLKDLGMPSELSPSGDMNETDLPANPETGKQMDLEAFAGSLSFGSLKVRGVHRQTEGGGVADLNPAEAEAEPSQEWKRSAAFMQVIARISLARRNKSRRQRRNLVELRKEVPDFPPSADLPRFPDQLGTAEEFFEQWKEGYLDVTIRFRDRSNQEILFYSTGLREHEASAPDEPDDWDEAGEPKGRWEGLKWIAEPKEDRGS
jgi:hypothetical protein